jgi:NAD-dependent deacetylase
MDDASDVRAPDVIGPELARAGDLLRSARRVVALTGAGISAESGIATFRDDADESGEGAGLWKQYDPMELATIDAFFRNPQLVTRWYHWRFGRVLSASPNAGHFALARMQREIESRGGVLTLITQNVDRFHQRAGSTGVIELHGNILTWRCLKTGRHYEMSEIPFESFPPRSEAGGLLRPNVVWFGEMLPAEAIMAADEAVSCCDLFLSIGTSAVVYPAAGYIAMAAHLGAPVVEINREATAASALVDVAIRGASGVVLPRLVEAAFGTAS